MQNVGEKLENLFSKTKNYVETSLELYKLQAIDFTADIISNVISKTVLILIFSMFLLFLNLGFGFYLANKFGSYALGFIVVAGMYLLFGVLFYLLRKNLIVTPISNLIITELNREREIIVNNKFNENEH